MEISLFCDELWLSNPDETSHEPKQRILERCPGCSFYNTKEDCEQASIICSKKELSYIPEPGYLEYLQSNNLMNFRLKAIQWLFKSRSRLNLCYGTVFNAANHLDRFISMNQCHGWKCWMIELLSVACLSVASKFTETSAPLLQEIQLEDLEHWFESSTIRRMELTLLQTLGWHLGCVTPYSYVELLLSNVDSLEYHLHNQLTTRFTQLLLGAMLDFKLLEFRPSLIAVSALRCCLDELIPSSCSHLASTSLLNQFQKDDLHKCHMIMKSRMVDPLSNILVSGQLHNWPSSPVTVLVKERIDIYDSQVDLSMFKLPGSNINSESCRKRKRQLLEH
ncbi:hypothetical protein Pint_35385 [Pistacia integerrima]|uniref:Uncharacterized protein n=1 Tax=Pistacia integerrima TaxID=434235 RepID=A0ACC0Y6C3_9ROSI|nr:hypothetical protein Pint_35385 [Pistacia integerrima]